MTGRWPNGEPNDFYFDEENLDQEDDASPYDREDPAESMYEYEPEEESEEPVYEEPVYEDYYG